jgi:hypothetical protein
MINGRSDNTSDELCANTSFSASQSSTFSTRLLIPGSVTIGLPSIRVLYVLLLGKPIVTLPGINSRVEKVELCEAEKLLYREIQD